MPNSDYDFDLTARLIREMDSKINATQTELSYRNQLQAANDEIVRLQKTKIAAEDALDVARRDKANAEGHTQDMVSLNRFYRERAEKAVEMLKSPFA